MTHARLPISRKNLTDFFKANREQEKQKRNVVCVCVCIHTGQRKGEGGEREVTSPQQPNKLKNDF